MIWFSINCSIRNNMTGLLSQAIAHRRVFVAISSDIPEAITLITESQNNLKVSVSHAELLAQLV